MTVNELRRTIELVDTPNGGLGSLNGAGRDAQSAIQSSELGHPNHIIKSHESLPPWLPH